MDRLKGDERILGDSDFVESVLQASQEALDHRYQLQEAGFTLETLSEKVAHLFQLEPRQILNPTKVQDCKSQESIVLFCRSGIGFNSHDYR